MEFWCGNRGEVEYYICHKQIQTTVGHSHSVVEVEKEVWRIRHKSAKKPVKNLHSKGNSSKNISDSSSQYEIGCKNESPHNHIMVCLGSNLHQCGSSSRLGP